jgi:hypothetical protein
MHYPLTTYSVCNYPFNYTILNYNSKILTLYLWFQFRLIEIQDKFPHDDLGLDEEKGLSSQVTLLLTACSWWFEAEQRGL